MRMLSVHDAQRAQPAPAAVAAQIVAEGLARTAREVVVFEGEVFTRAYLGDGVPAAFFLSVGRMKQ